VNLAALVNLAVAETLSILKPTHQHLIGEGMAEAYINEAYRLVETAQEWPWSHKSATISLASGTAEISSDSEWPTDVAVVLGMRNNDVNEDMVLYDLRQQHPLSETGEPTYYGRWANKYYVYPTGDSSTSITVYYIYAWDALESSSQVPVIPVQFHHILSRYAAAKLIENLSFKVDMAEATYAWKAAEAKTKDFNEQLASMQLSHITDYSRDAIPSIDITRDVYGEVY